MATKATNRTRLYVDGPPNTKKFLQVFAFENDITVNAVVLRAVAEAHPETRADLRRSGKLNITKEDAQYGQA